MRSGWWPGFWWKWGGIIGPGKDGKLGRGGSLAELSEEDRDNVVSFAKVVVGEIDVEEVAAELEE